VSTPNGPALGAEGERCRACGAPLAPDQRYCLNCGVRRADSRVPFPETLARTGTVPAPGGAGSGDAAGGAGAAAATADAATTGKRSWLDRELLLPVLGSGLLALAVGILIGQGSESTPVAQKAPVVNFTAGAGAGAATAAPTATTADTSSSDSSSSGSTKQKTTKVDSSAKSTKANVSSDQLKAQQNATGDDYVKKSQKLPTTLSTGGKPPPKDNKKAGGGSPSATIG
jgi:hypothetical protein